MAIRGYVLIETEVGSAKSVGESMQHLDHKDARVIAVDTVTGPFDVIVQLEADDLDRLGFVDQTNCVAFTKETFRAKADEYLANPGDGRWLRIRHAGREMVRSRHTLSRRLAALDAHVRTWAGRRADRMSISA